MKNLEQLKKLSVLAVNEGIECGAITELIIDPVKKQADYIVVDDGTGCLGLKLLPVEAIKSVGVEFATILAQSDLKLFGDTAASLKNKLSSKQIIGLRAISSEGYTIGSVTEIAIDEKTGSIVELNISDSANIPNENIVAITAKMITAKSATVASEAEEEKPAAPAAAAAEPAAETGKAFKQRSHEFLVGKTATQDIVDSQGAVLIKAGEVVTEQIIKTLEEKNEIVKLIMNVSKD